MGDGWEPGPNPVAQIIATRTAQVGGGAAVALAGLGAALPPDRLWPLVLGGGALVTGGLSAYFVATFHARSPVAGPLLTRLPASAGNAVAFTFDDGPHPETTPRLLDRLAEAGAAATFFLVAERAKAYPNLARRVADAGHAIGVHGLRHRTMVLQSGRQIADDLCDAARVLENVTGRPLGSRLLRPPYGFKTWTLGRTARRLGWTLAAWSLDPRDYDPHTPESLAARLIGAVSPRDIILLHERPGDAATAEALPAMLRHCRERGLRCVGLDRAASVVDDAQEAPGQSGNSDK